MKWILRLTLAAAVTCAAQAQSYQGYLEAANCSTMSGWLWDASNPNASVWVDLFDGATLIDTVNANQYRADLKAMGLGTGKYGWSYNTPPSLKNGQNHVLHGYVAGTALELGNSPMTLNCPAGATGYQYYYSDALASVNGNNWIENGSGSTGAAGLTSAGAAALISSAAVSPRSTVSYEVDMRLALKQSGGYYAALLRASNDAILSGASAGTFYAIEVSNPQISGNSCAATLIAWKVQAGGATALTSTQIACYDGMVVRSVMLPNGYLLAYINGIPYLQVYDASIGSGAPGVAVAFAPAQNSVSLLQLGAIDTVAPNAINAQTVGRSMTPSSVNLHWPGVADNPNGIGLYAYQIYRHDTNNPNDIWLGASFTPQFADETIPPSASPLTYTYTLQPIDYHWNVANTVIQATPPAAGSIDPREVGVRPTGSYWGGAGEQIDMRSGNLNFTVPLFKVNGRGWTVPFNLTYNSQVWRQDPGGTWNFGVDAGFGYGWKMQGGSLAPVYAGWFNIDHYLFTDASGAEYRLDVNTNGIWTSRESIYMEWDANAGRLYFPDGTYWVFGCISGGTEQDAGTAYPTLIEDSNGNQVTIAYAAGQGTTGAGNSSSRMTAIQDIIGSYTITYTEGWTPHILTVASLANPTANYTFRYWPSANLTSPFDGSTNVLGQTLKSVINAAGDTELGYTPAGELSYVFFPYGGSLAWYYQNFTYAGGATLRGLVTRQLSMSAGASALTYNLYWGWSAGCSFNANSVVSDADGQSKKWWIFQSTDSTQANYGLQTEFSEQQTNYGEKRSIWSYWTWDGLGRPYISSSYTLFDQSSSPAENRTDQVLDQYGNATSISQYDFGSPRAPGSPTRVYTNTYLTDSPTPAHPAGSNYSAEHIHNRLLTSAVTQNGQTTTLVSNLYDFYNPNACQTNGQNITPTGWAWGYAASGLDPNNTANVFRGNVTTSYGLDMTHALCYATTGAVFMRTDGGHVTSGQTSSQTNYTAPSAITTGSLTTSLNWTGFLGLSSVTGPNGDSSAISYDAASAGLDQHAVWLLHDLYLFDQSAANHCRDAHRRREYQRPPDGNETRRLWTRAGSGHD